MISDKEFIDLERRVREIEKRLNIPITREEKIEEVRKKRESAHFTHKLKRWAEESEKSREEFIKSFEKEFGLDETK